VGSGLYGFLFIHHVDAAAFRETPYSGEEFLAVTPCDDFESFGVNPIPEEQIGGCRIAGSGGPCEPFSLRTLLMDRFGPFHSLRIEFRR